MSHCVTVVPAHPLQLHQARRAASLAPNRAPAILWPFFLRNVHGAAARAKRPSAIVALGASAGGLESLGRLLEGLPASFPAPIVVTLHLDPDHRSQAVMLLQNRARLQVRDASAGALLEPGKVYVAPPDHHLEVRAGRVHLTHAARVSYSRPSVDVLFASVAKQYGPSAIVVVLSGTGSDGAAGVAAVKARGGLAVAEDISTAGFAGMPVAAGRSGLLDAVLPISQIAPFLIRAVAHRVTVSERQWRRLLDIVEQRTGTRFSRYRSTTLYRRLQQRLLSRGCRTMTAYLRLLHRDPSEAERLQAAFLIKVSSFTRDAESWRALRRELPALAAAHDGVRAWSAGCATGEEAYTLAIALARSLGTGKAATWKVFATDLDDGALNTARAGRYTGDQVRGIARADLAEYFVQDLAGWRVGKALRNRVVFGKHDLLRDPPLSGMDLLACRNVLIYFTPTEKDRALRRLTFALRPGGLLFLGRSEALRPVPGFERVGNSTFFRRSALPDDVPKKKTEEARESRKRPAARKPPSRRKEPAVSRPGLPAGEGLAAQQDLNEELQSRNEELETVNEELQSLNDELSTMEEQMRGLGEEARRTNEFLRVLLDTSAEALVACDPDNRVTFWNKEAIRRFRLSPAQAMGGNLLELVPALATPALRAAGKQVRGPGRGGRVEVTKDGVLYVFEPLPHGSSKRRGYLLRVAAVPG